MLWIKLPAVATKCMIICPWQFSVYIHRSRDELVAVEYFSHCMQFSCFPCTLLISVQVQSQNAKRSIYIWGSCEIETADGLVESRNDGLGNWTMPCGSGWTHRCISLSVVRCTLLKDLCLPKTVSCLHTHIMHFIWVCINTAQPSCCSTIAIMLFGTAIAILLLGRGFDKYWYKGSLCMFTGAHGRDCVSIIF